MGPPKILYLSVRSEAVPIYLNTAYKLVHQNLFRLYTDCVKTFKYVINCHRVRSDLIIDDFIALIYALDSHSFNLRANK